MRARELQVACGETHSVALTSDGQVSTKTFFSSVQHMHFWKDCAFSSSANFLTTIIFVGQVFTWGRGKYGQLGHGTAQTGNFPVAVRALADHHVIQIACGGDHTIALNSDGKIFSVSLPLPCSTLLCVI